jgi:hypothetical protein
MTDMDRMMSSRRSPAGDGKIPAIAQPEGILTALPLSLNDPKIKKGAIEPKSGRRCHRLDERLCSLSSIIRHVKRNASKMKYKQLRNSLLILNVLV